MAGEITRGFQRFSVCKVMEAIVHCGPVSRASVAKQTGLSKQTISEIAAFLENGGWIRESGRTQGHVGRSAVTYEIVPDAACIAAVDLGGTKVRAAAADLSCRVLSEVSEPTDRRGGVFAVRQIARLCRAAARKNKIPFDRIRLAAVGVPGVPDAETGSIQMAPNIPGFEDQDIAAALRSEIGVEVILENDVNLAVTGEHWAGAGAGVDNLVYIALGTGVGAGVMVDGALVRGAGGAAGELGFLPFGADPFEDESRRVGALERVTATAGMKARHRALTGEDVDVPEIFDRAERGEDAAVKVLDETARCTARAVAAVAAVINPARVVMGGSIGARPEIISRVQSILPGCMSRPVRIVPSALGPRAALIGGAAAGLSCLHAALFSGGAPDAEMTLPPAEVVMLSKAAQ